MEVIHRYNGFYPFSLEQEASLTYLQVLKQNLREEDIAIFRKKYKFIKEIDHTNLIKLVKIYKEQSTLHLLYDYFSLSLESYLQEKSHERGHNGSDLIKEIHHQFMLSLTNIINILTKFCIKTDIMIQNFAVFDAKTCHLKLFIDPDAEFLAIESAQNCFQVAENIIKYKQGLGDFYSAEKKRLIMEFQQLLEKYFGKSSTVSQFNRPNFVINGSKLVFLNHSDTKLAEKHKNNLINEARHQKLGKTDTLRRQMHSNSPPRLQKGDAKREFKQKTLKKIEQIKHVLSQLESKSSTVSHDQHKQYPNEPDEIIFRPEEITNDKTALLEEEQYLQALQNQLNKINSLKNKHSQRSSSDEKRSQMIKQLNEIQQKSKKEGSENQLPSDTHREKTNKYKMKIITSHEIEIEGSNNPKQEKQMMEMNRSGKIGVGEKKLQRPKTVKLQSQVPHRLSDVHKQKMIFADSSRINSRNSDIASKSQKINEIIGKINSKTSFHQQLSSSAHNNQHKSEVQQPAFKSNIESVDHHTDNNYLEKFREAKQKAEQVLKDYARKKH